MLLDAEVLKLVAGVVVVLITASTVAFVLGRRAKTPKARNTVANLEARVNAWWVMVGLMVGALAIGRGGWSVLFGSCRSSRSGSCSRSSRLGGRTTRACSGRSSSRCRSSTRCCGPSWYGMFAIFVPVYGFLALSVADGVVGRPRAVPPPGRGDPVRADDRRLLPAHAPALLMLRIQGYEGQQWKLFVFLIVVVQASDVLQYIWGKPLGRPPIAPVLSPSKTVEGFVGGILSATALGGALWWLTPFFRWWRRRWRW